MLDQKVVDLFLDTNNELSQFYLGKMSQDWVEHFGGHQRIREPADIRAWWPRPDSPSMT